MTPQRRTALVSVIAALALIALKLGAGLASGSLGLVSEAIHSGTDLVAALLTFFALGVAVRPADPEHPYGHGKAEHLAALAEAAILVLASLFISYRALSHSSARPHSGRGRPGTRSRYRRRDRVDASRTVVSLRGARRYGSPALQANALHFGSDLAGSIAVLVGLLLARAGYPGADSLAALFVAVLVLLAAARLMRGQRRRADGPRPLPTPRQPRARRSRRRAAGRAAPAAPAPAAGRHFADVVIGVPPGAAVGQGHAAADGSSGRSRTRCPRATSSSTSSPRTRRRSASGRTPPRSAFRACARSTTSVSCGRRRHRGRRSTSSSRASSRSRRRTRSPARSSGRSGALPEVVAVQTHLEPLARPRRRAHGTAGRGAVAPSSGSTGEAPREVRLVRTDEGLLVFVTLRARPTSPLAEAHALASQIEERIREERRRSPTSWCTPSREALHVQLRRSSHLERGWPGRIEGDRVIQLAAQTLQSFFTGGGRRASTPSTRSTRSTLPPVLHPPSVRDFYAFEQHVKTARARRGLEVPEEWYGSRSSTSRTRR